MVYTMKTTPLLFLLFIQGVRPSVVHDVWNELFVNQTYNKNVRPVKDESTPTTVNISLSLITVIEFNEVEESIITAGRIELIWRDEYLTWDPTQYQNVNHIHVPQADVWKPYIFLENSVTKQSELGTPSLRVIVKSDGTVTWTPIEVFHTTCAADVRKFPFDTQVCSMIFETFGYTSAELAMNAVSPHIEFHGFSGSSGWTIGESLVKTEEENSAVHVVCSLVLKRKPTYFLLNIFFPISLLSFLNICVFILPVQSGEKASFVVTVFLSLAVFLTIVSNRLPENSTHISMLNTYVFISTILSTVIAFMTIVQIRVYHRDPAKPVPVILQRIAMACTSVSASHSSRVSSETSTSTSVIELSKADEKRPVEAFVDKVDDKVIDWRTVAKALDNILLVVFLLFNLIMTATVLGLAARYEKVEFEDDH